MAQGTTRCPVCGEPSALVEGHLVYRYGCCSPACVPRWATQQERLAGPDRRFATRHPLLLDPGDDAALDDQYMGSDSGGSSLDTPPRLSTVAVLPSPRQPSTPNLSPRPQPSIFSASSGAVASTNTAARLRFQRRVDFLHQPDIDSSQDMMVLSDQDSPTVSGAHVISAGSSALAAVAEARAQQQYQRGRGRGRGRGGIRPQSLFSEPQSSFSDKHHDNVNAQSRISGAGMLHLDSVSAGAPTASTAAGFESFRLAQSFAFDQGIDPPSFRATFARALHTCVRENNSSIILLSDDGAARLISISAIVLGNADIEACCSYPQIRGSSPFRVKVDELFSIPTRYLGSIIPQHSMTALGELFPVVSRQLLRTYAQRPVGDQRADPLRHASGDVSPIVAAIDPAQGERGSQADDASDDQNISVSGDQNGSEKDVDGNFPEWNDSEDNNSDFRGRRHLALH